VLLQPRSQFIGTPRPHDLRRLTPTRVPRIGRPSAGRPLVALEVGEDRLGVPAGGVPGDDHRIPTLRRNGYRLIENLSPLKHPPFEFVAPSTGDASVSPFDGASRRIRPLKGPPSASPRSPQYRDGQQRQQGTNRLANDRRCDRRFQGRAGLCGSLERHLGPELVDRDDLGPAAEPILASKERQCRCLRIGCHDADAETTEGQTVVEILN
jgi:hypothetical protein